jgi:hypothetical protein
MNTPIKVVIDRTKQKFNQTIPSKKVRVYNSGNGPIKVEKEFSKRDMHRINSGTSKNYELRNITIP